MQISGFLVLIGAMIASRMIGERGYRALDAEQKVRLMDGFSGSRAYSMIPLFVLIAVYWFLNSQTNLNKGYLTMGYFGLLIAFVIARTIWSQRRLAQLNLPADCNRMFTLAQVVSFVGIAWFFFTMLYE